MGQEKKIKEKYLARLREFLKEEGQEEVSSVAELTQKLVEAEMKPEEIVELHLGVLDTLSKENKLYNQPSSIKRSLYFLLQIMISHTMVYQQYLDSRDLSILERIAGELSTVLDLKSLLDLIIERATAVMEAKRGSLMLVDHESGMLVIKAARGLKEDVVKEARVKVGEQIVGWVAQDGKPLLVIDIEKDSRFKKKLGKNYQTGSFISVPLKAGNQVLGVINVADRVDSIRSSFNQEDLRLLCIIAHQSAVAIEHALLFEKAEQMAITDDLTNLYNRRFLRTYLPEEVERAKRYRRNLSLVMLDIDHFKDYNDTHGHLMGDQVLREIGQVIKSTTRKSDTSVRYGGEEFVVVFPEANLRGAIAAAEKIRRAVEEHKFLREESQRGGKITISGGAASYSLTQSEVAEGLLGRADEQLYRAKREGRNKICF